MDGQPDDVDPAEAAERAQWERALRVRQEHDDELQRQADARIAAEPPPPPERSSRRVAAIALALALVFVVAAGVMLVVVRHRSNQQPAWVAQLGLDKSGSGSADAPSRLGTPGSGTTPVDPGGTDPGGTDLPATAGPTDAPDIVTTGEDFDHVYRQIETLEGWLLIHPDPSRVADIYQPGTAPYDDLVSQLTQLRSAHQTLHVENYRIVGVTVDQRPAPDQVVLRYADTYTDAVTVAETTGAVVSRAPYDGRARLWTLTLHRGDDGRWRVAATAFVQYGDVPTG